MKKRTDKPAAKKKRIHNPETLKKASAKFAKNKIIAGEIKISVSQWVPESLADECRAAAKKAISKVIKNKSK